MSDRDRTVLVVDDEVQITELYSQFLSREHTVRTANGGEGALEAMDDAVDVVLLDRRMPDRSGDEVLEEIRARGFDCPVVMMTAVSPDVDIVGMSFNEYLTKPVSKDELRATVEQALELSERDVQLQEYFALLDKQLALEDELGLGGVLESEEYLELQRRLEALRERMNPPTTPFEEELAERLTRKWPSASTEPDLEF